MSNNYISDYQRIAVWEAHDKKCFYCREIIRYTDLHIDHVIPEHKNTDIEFVNNIVSEYGLADSFGINTYYNWVPCHAQCNLRKGSHRFEKPAELYYLALTARKFEACNSVEVNLRSKQKTEKLLVALALCIESGAIKKEDIAAVIANIENTDGKFTILRKIKFLEKELIGSVDRSTAEELLDMPLDMSYTNLDCLPMEKGYDQIIKVRTCREWRKALDDGYDYSCNFHYKVGTHFIMVCGLIRALLKAKTADVSYVRDLGVLDIKYIPVTLYPALSNDECQELYEEEKKGVTIRDWVDSGRLIIKDASKYSIRLEEKEGMGFVMSELLRADLNDDGKEEILIYEYSYATHGTFGYGCLKMIEKNNSESNFVVSEFTGA